jgi:hypothetical protein
MRLSTSLRLNAQKGLVTPYDPALTLDLQFAARQAYVANIGPLPTFTNASTTRTFVGSDGLIQTAATNVPRIDFDPVTRLCRGLLLEEQRQNLCIWSEDTTQGVWAKSGVTATANTTTAPDGSGSADTISETTANSQHFFYSSPASITIGVAYSNSIFLKKGSGGTAPDWVVIAFLSAGFGSKSIAFNVSTGVFGVSGGGLTGISQAYPNGWWRVSFSATATASGTHGSIYIGFTNNANTISTPTYTGQLTSNVFVWGAQVEAGAFATSYIPTTTTSLIRSADVCSITGAAFTGFYNQTEGTIVVKFRRSSIASSHNILAINDGTLSERINNQYTASIERFSVSDAGGTSSNLDQAFGTAVNLPVGHACRMKLNDYAFSCNGIAPVTNATQTMPTVTQMTLGYRLGSEYMNGWIQAVQYYNTIKTNAQLQDLSTP